MRNVAHTVSRIFEKKKQIKYISNDTIKELIGVMCRKCPGRLTFAIYTIFFFIC